MPFDYPNIVPKRTLLGRGGVPQTTSNYLNLIQRVFFNWVLGKMNSLKVFRNPSILLNWVFSKEDYTNLNSAQYCHMQL